ncbi:beta strand repeat-containing protein [Mesorhizobium sp. IMUNJ 23232]|uniref:beta strand repeat-containing protein n=1 Tax=Mesorhizobium sp. IMUNJ 23232 TaxID=3376064 RepID=UPI0037B32FAE
MTVNASSLIRISVDSSGASANAAAVGGPMSGDGRYVVFESGATNLVAGDANGFFDVFLRDTVTGTTTLLSTATDGTQGNNASSVAAITDDGRYVFFSSSATNLVGGDTNAASDLFMRDALTGVTTRVSTDSGGGQANGLSLNVDVTGDGAFISFASAATNLVAGDSNGFDDAFIKNMSTGLVTRISVADDESQANGTSSVARLSNDGNHVSFVSLASNLTANDTNGTVGDVFVRDIAAGTTTLVSASTTGGSGNAVSNGASISGNGRYVVFVSIATNLVAGDTNGAADIFVRDLQTNTTTRVSTATDGSESNVLSNQAVISADGRYVVFVSGASNLVQGDTNGRRDVFLKDTVTGNVTRLSVAIDGTELNDLSSTPLISADGRYVTFQTQATDTGVGAEGNGTGLDVFRISLVASAVADRMIGSDGNDTIDGLAGDDIITGGFGDDIITGGLGDDTLIGGAGADALTGGGGVDTADYSGSSGAVSVNLAAGTGSGGDAQGDTLTGFTNALGSAFNDSLTGNGAGTLDGLAGDDILSGGATLNGGTGNDTLLAGASAETLDGGADNDTVSYAGSAAGVTVDLGLSGPQVSAGDAFGDTLTDIENLNGSAFNDSLTGNGAGTLDGLAGNDILSGAAILNGGAGNDALLGSAGAETLDGGADNDTVSYAGSAAGVTVDLGLSGPQVSAGDASGDTLTDIENLKGSALADTLTGDAGNNILNDGGVGGADTLTGGGGNDTYSVYNAGAVIVEVAGEGNDRVSAGVDYVLASGVSVEYLNTTSVHATYAVNLTGNEIAQIVRGNDGANVLDGAGGNDFLVGMGGADTFRFSTALGAGNVDKITDFSVADDQIQLDSAIFTALGTGPLDASAFKDNFLGPRDADDRIFYNSNSGSLFYDADGSGNGFAAVKFASLTRGLSLTAADFIVV